MSEQSTREWLLQQLQLQRDANAKLEQQIRELEEQIRAQERKEMCNSCVIVDCRGMRCRISHRDGKGVHCKACYEEKHENVPVRIISRSREVVQCRGTRCRLNNDDVYCESCFGPSE